MGTESQARIRFAGFLLDIGRGRLLCGDKDVALRPKSFALLSHLARNPGRVVSKDELLTALWPGLTVTEDSVTQCVHEVRCALGTAGPALLRTIPRRGYLFVVGASGAAAEPGATPAGDAAQHGTVEGAAPRLRPDGIAVLPIGLAAAGDPSDALLLDGLAHDVISRLARLRSFHVIARGSAFALRHLTADPQAAGRALGVAYAVSGGAVLSGGRVRLRVDLVRVEDGAILWTEDLSESRARFLTMLPTLTERIVRSVEMQVTASEIRRALATPEEQFDAWEHFHAGLHDAYRFDPERIGRALERLRAAARLDPGFSRAHAGQSFCHYFRAFSGVAPDRAAEVTAARRTAEEALRTDDANPTAHWAYGRALWLEGDPEGCLQHSHRAVALSPGFALGHYMVGFVETHCGNPRRGLERMDRMLALSPFDPFLASVQITRAFALMRLGDLSGAAVHARDAVRQPNAYSTLFAPAALILASAGRIEEARGVARRLREIAPDFGAEHMYRSLYCLSEDVAAQFRKHAPVIGL